MIIYVFLETVKYNEKMRARERHREIDWKRANGKYSIYVCGVLRGIKLEIRRMHIILWDYVSLKIKRLKTPNKILLEKKPSSGREWKRKWYK